MREDPGELLEVHVSLPVARPGGRPPFEDEAPIRAVHEQLFLAALEDSPREEEVHESVPTLRGALHPFDRRHEVLDLDEIRDRQVGEGINDHHRVVRVLIEEGNELFQDVRRREVEYVRLFRPRRGHDAVPEIRAREVLEDRVVAEGPIVVSVEGRRELLQNDLLRPRERHVADPVRDLGIIATIAKVVMTRLRTLVDERGLRCGRVDVLLHPRTDVATEQDRRAARQSAVDDAVQVRDAGGHLPDAGRFQRFRQSVHTEEGALSG